SSIRSTTDSACRSAPSATAFLTWTVASYLAWIGQIGTQEELQAPAGRLSKGRELRAWGVVRSSTGTVSTLSPASLRLTMRSEYDSQISDIGKGLERVPSVGSFQSA